jgi:hypothetical protein
MLAIEALILGKVFESDSSSTSLTTAIGRFLFVICEPAFFRILLPCILGNLFELKLLSNLLLFISEL